MLRSVLITSVIVHGSKIKTLQRNHRPQLLSSANLRYVADLSNENYTNKVLDNILIPRVVGTQNHQKVFNYITSELQNLSWHVHIDEFEDNTPVFGKLIFKNIVATLNPKADRYLVLACHYDSKYFENEIFVGATDSAVPCAMLLNLAKVMKDDLSVLKDNTNLNIKLIFFDGEEAFLRWGPNDSIYGAKHLANIYNNNVNSVSTGEIISDLQKIDVFVLLDLIGHKGTQFYCNFAETQNWYLKLAEAEDELTSLGLLKKKRNQRIFHKRAFYGQIEDDHIPFLNKDVPILHLIAYPFPEEWHTPDDDRDIIDMDTVENINKILRVFITQYLGLLTNSCEKSGELCS